MGEQKSFKEKVIDIWEEIQENCYYKKVDQAIYDIRKGIHNLIVWFPVIWADRNWDHWFLYKIMHKKLERMEYLQRHYGHHTQAEKTADQIKVCKILLKRLIDDNYIMNATKYHEEKWGELELVTDPIPGTSLFSVKTKTNKPLTEKEQKQEHKERMNAYNHADKMKEQDLDMLFAIMRKHIQGWWD